MNYVLLFGMPGGGELFFIVLIIIMLFGSKKIPELARGLGKGMREIKNATSDIQREIRDGARDLNAMKDSVDVEKRVKDMIIGDKKEKQEPREDNKEETEEGSESESKQQLSENQKPETNPEQPNPQTVKRESPFGKEEPQNPSENS